MFSDKLCQQENQRQSTPSGAYRSRLSLLLVLGSEPINASRESPSIWPLLFHLSAPQKRLDLDVPIYRRTQFVPPSMPTMKGRNGMCSRVSAVGDVPSESLSGECACVMLRKSVASCCAAGARSLRVVAPSPTGQNGVAVRNANGDSSGPSRIHRLGECACVMLEYLLRLKGATLRNGGP